MNTTLTAPAQTSFHWMLELGVSAIDVTWLEQMSGSVELHMPGNRDRVEYIWKKAIGLMLDSASTAVHLAHAMN